MQKAKILELTAEMMKEFEAQKPNHTKLARPQSKLTFSLYLTEVFIQKVIERFKNVDESLLYLKAYSSYEVAEFFEFLTSFIEDAIELSEHQDRTAVYNARKG